jgi:hypothetical protein
MASKWAAGESDSEVEEHHEPQDNNKPSDINDLIDDFGSSQQQQSQQHQQRRPQSNRGERDYRREEQGPLPDHNKGMLMRLPEEITIDEIGMWLNKDHGCEILDIQLITRHEEFTGRAVVEFADQNSLKKFLSLNESSFKGKTVIAKVFDDSRAGSGGGFGGRGGGRGGGRSSGGGRSGSGFDRRGERGDREGGRGFGGGGRGPPGRSDGGRYSGINKSTSRDSDGPTRSSNRGPPGEGGRGGGFQDARRSGAGGGRDDNKFYEKDEKYHRTSPRHGAAAGEEPKKERDEGAGGGEEETPKERKKLVLAPRTKPIGESTATMEIVKPKADIFGGGRPHDDKEYEVYLSRFCYFLRSFLTLSHCDCFFFCFLFSLVFRKRNVIYNQ